MLRIALEEFVVVSVARFRILCPIFLFGSLLGSNRSLTFSGGSSFIAGVEHECGQAEGGGGLLGGGEGGVEDQAHQPGLPLRRRRSHERRERGADAPGGLHGGVEGKDLGDAVGAGGAGGLRDGVGHRDEGEARVARGVRRVERRVEDGDCEPPRAERAGQLQHRADVALERQREQRDAGSAPAVRFSSSGAASHSRSPAPGASRCSGCKAWSCYI